MTTVSNVDIMFVYSAYIIGVLVDPSNLGVQKATQIPSMLQFLQVNNQEMLNLKVMKVNTSSLFPVLTWFIDLR